MEVRPYHLEHAKTGHEVGWIGASLQCRVRGELTRRAVSAGATFADDHGDYVPPKMTGSWCVRLAGKMEEADPKNRFLLREESLEKARARLSQDVYVTGGAWDMSKVHQSFVRWRGELTLCRHRRLSRPSLLPSTRARLQRTYLKDPLSKALSARGETLTWIQRNESFVPGAGASIFSTSFVLFPDASLSALDPALLLLQIPTDLPSPTATIHFPPPSCTTTHL